MAKRFPVIFAMTVGFGMIAMWLFFIFSGNVPEFQTKPWEIGLHLAAEFTTAILLVVSSFMYIKKLKAGKMLLLAAHGMLLYTLIVSPGYYAGSGDIGFVIMFAALLCLAVISLVLLIKRQPDSSQ